jgi:hypothetical protein
LDAYEKEPPMIYELRHYTLFPDSFERMLRRFREVNLPLFRTCGIAVDQIWSHPTDPNKFSFLMSFPSEEARKTAWERYHADPIFLAGKEEQATIIESIEWHVLQQITVGE